MFSSVNRQQFRAYFNNARRNSDQTREATSEFTHVEGTSYFLEGTISQGYVAGYAIRADGELVYVFSTARGHGDDIVADAVYNGAVYLDCFAGYLPELYGRHGFEIVATVPNWTPGGPDVVFMSLPGFADRHWEVMIAIPRAKVESERLRKLTELLAPYIRKA